MVKKKILWEILLVVASVPMFRSVWILLDKIAFLNTDTGLWVSLASGIVVAMIALFMLYYDKKSK